MRGSHLPNPMICLALLGAATLAVTPAMAADAVGPPTSLFPPSAIAAASPTAPQPPRNVASANSPGRHPALPVQRTPIDSKPLIPPAALPAKLGPPPPEPRPALPLDTGLQPLAPSSPATSSPGAVEEASPSASKPPSS